MKAIEIINKELILEAIKPLAGGKKGILVLDIDDTILTAKNIYIHKIKDGKETLLTPEQYAEDPDSKTKPANVKFSYEEFRDPKKVRNSIETGNPIIKNLKVMDSHINSGWDIAILTARGLEDIIFKSLESFLMFRNPEGELKSIKGILARNMVHAINDETKIYEGMSDAEKKGNVLKELAKKYSVVKFLDDDDKNLNTAKKLGLKNLQTIKAWKGEK